MLARSHRWLLITALTASLFAVACHHDDPSPDGEVPVDASPPDIQDAGLADLKPGHCTTRNDCPSGLICYRGDCIKDNGSCRSDNDCENDTWCACPEGDGGCGSAFCVPWGDPPRGTFDPGCRVDPMDGFLSPETRCVAQGHPIAVSPAVADINRDGRTEAIVVNFIEPFGPEARLEAIDTTDCQVLFSKSYRGLVDSQQVAVADLDGDGSTEIVGNINNFVSVFDAGGNLLATAGVSFVRMRPRAGFQGGPVLVDLDGKPPAEIVMSAQVLRYSKAKGLEVVCTAYPGEGFYGALSAVADIDGDGQPEILAGTRVYDSRTCADKTPPLLQKEPPVAASAVADFNLDGKPDLVFVGTDLRSPEHIGVYDFANARFLLGRSRAAAARRPSWMSTETVCRSSAPQAASTGCSICNASGR